MKAFRWVLVLVLCGLAASAWAKPSDKWRLHCDGRADSDGAVTLLISPLGGNPIEVSVAIEKGTGENNVARALRDGLREQLDEELFDIDRDDGEEVRIKARRGAADFELEVVSVTAEGVKVKTDRE